MLSSLGKRIERLLYSGFLLILLGFAELYFSNVAIQFKKSGEDIVGLLINKISTDSAKLQAAFDRPSKESLIEARSARENRVSVMRRELGLNPKIEQVGESKSYGQLLREIRESLPDKGLEHAYDKFLRSDLSPERIVDNLKAFEKSQRKESVTVWGVETPRNLPVKYAGLGYQIPSDLVASALFVALLPIQLVWLMSLYITRQRELLLIRELSDYRQAFPHVLNIFPVTFLRMAQQLGIHQSRKSLYYNRKLMGLVTCCIRLAVLLMYVSPILACLALSAWNLSDFFITGGVGMILALLVAVFELGLCFQIILQEAMLLYRKDFYA